MIRAKYKGEFYKLLINENNMEIVFQGEKEGFQRRWKGREIVSYKNVERSELEAVYKIQFYAIWNGEQFEFDHMRGTSIISLWRFTRSTELAEKYGFKMISRDEYVKEVEIAECDYFIMVFRDYYEVQKSAEEIKLSKEEFADVYRKFVYEM